MEPLPRKWDALLERYRLRSRRHHRPGLTGGHIMRHKGQSLEFREMAHYIPGDDIRHVDWRASLRHSLGEDLLIRHYVAEEHLTLFVSLDSRESMRLPRSMPKLQVGLWLIEAMARIASGTGDSVVAHDLFGANTEPMPFPKDSSGVRTQSALRRLRDIFSTVGPASRLALPVRQLRPASVWIIVTDLYCDSEELSALARNIVQARQGWRWVIVVELDAWPCEKSLLGVGPRKVEGPGLRHRDPRFEIDQKAVQTVEKAMVVHKRRLRQALGSDADWITWKWPAQAQPDTVSFFQETFFEDPVLQRLFMRGF